MARSAAFFQQNMQKINKQPYITYKRTAKFIYSQLQNKTMIRGDRGSAALVLAAVSIIGVFAIAGLIEAPTGLVAQGQSFYPTVPSAQLGLSCPSGQAVYLYTNGAYNQYCCLDDMIGQNACITIHNILARNAEELR